MQMRTTKPSAGNKYYIRKASGGWSDAITGYPKDGQCDVLSNCVGYAYGRFNEIGNYGYCKYLRPVNAENFINYAGGLSVGQTPKIGACMVWQQGTSSASDGAGHVAIVERVNADGSVYTSESGYGSSAFWNQTRYNKDGKWGAGGNFKFLGFIYNPATANAATPSVTTTATTSGNTYKVVAGDTLSKIASKFGTTYQELAKINGIDNPNKIYVGQVIKLQTTNATSSGKTYTVVTGDTLGKIAGKFGTTYQELAKVNGIADPNKIYPGQVLIIK